ncbi:MAG TPA: hypothetical protein GX701_02030 [Clostridiales bacterium]|nr:hypothetical protein [Clostridiales bacterium]
MTTPYNLTPQPTRFSTHYAHGDEKIPAGLTCSGSFDFTGFPHPLPSAKSEYKCFAECDGVVWMGASTGLTRYEKNASRPENVIQYFSAPRDLLDNDVQALLAEKDGVWVQTAEGVTHIEMKVLSMKDKADLLLDESIRFVDRRGMYSQRKLERPRDLCSRVFYGHSDNDGLFTANFALGEIFHYAVLAAEKGEDDPETQYVRAIATRACEACLLLMNISGRGNGFVARSYMVGPEPIPNGLFYRKKNGKATCLETNSSRKRGIAGIEIDASHPVPERLARLYTDEGFTDNDVTYKGDTSSDEITGHFLHLRYAYDILGPGDPELAELIRMSVRNTMEHIVDNGYQLVECDGKPTTWAKWSPEYFSDGLGWVDACLNSAQVLMYLQTTMHILGEKGKWQEAYDHLLSLGYADLPEKHHDRFYQASLAQGLELYEDIMYGDHMLAACAFWGLIDLEKDEVLKNKFRKGIISWRPSIAREHNPFYDMAFKLACPDEEIDMEALATWLYRTNPSRLAAGVSLEGRKDVAMRVLSGGYKETSFLLPPDERFISKYDRNPWQYRNEDSGGIWCVESCYVYTLAYWMGRYFGFWKEA